jgi:hypothetical protein
MCYLHASEAAAAAEALAAATAAAVAEAAVVADLALSGMPVVRVQAVFRDDNLCVGFTA